MEEWVKLHTTYYTDAKVEALPDADTEVMFTRGLARAGELKRAGFIPEESLPKLARRRRYAASVEALLAAGLWTKVDGGYRITNWDHWQSSLDALTRRRTADRERQRRRRASAAEPTADSGMSRDIDSSSRDMSRDVTDTEREGEREGVKVGDIAHPYAYTREAPPPKCPRHLNDPNPPPCGPCGDARKARQAWDRDRAAADARARQQQAQDHAATLRAAIDACRRCDRTGLIHGKPCPHDDHVAERIQRGLAAAQAVLNRPRLSRSEDQ